MTKYRTPKDWDKNKRTVLGVIYECPNCSNQNAKPLFNSNNQPYCSSCLVNYNKVFIMKKREVIDFLNRNTLRKPFRG
ncbi:hypothetical protein GRF59_14630 [Paenibacillus sp. HJL G12]|uniref:Uncharacterized protein n=1 Tax=Paenibacillus dendrobii TaxID=2691084 RepID=A0A7X3LJ04_9BACL|nr:hypothetical protein [Paenibacillus dendrobii]MWV44854.1 hypothetical protein [Paenibacillus dendrobii]